MSLIKLSPIQTPIKGVLKMPGDKSITHRAIILGSLAKGTTNVTNFLPSDDCLQTIEAFKNLGVKINKDGNSLTIIGKGKQLKEPLQPLYFGNSGTTARLLLGVLAGQSFFTTVYGDQFLRCRPMGRVVTPLQKMGAMIDGRKQGNYLPLSIRGKQLSGITYEMPVKSAQVKSSILLAGLFAKETTTIIEQTRTRDHTERMLQAFGCHVNISGNKVSIKGQSLVGTNLTIPGDISSAAFFLVAAAMIPGSRLTIKEVGLNETRTGIIDVMQKMGANITITNVRKINREKVGDIFIQYRPLKGTTIKGNQIPRVIDEIPIIALLASQARGETHIRDAQELRIKETDRIQAIVNILSTLNVNIKELPDGMIISGGNTLTGGKVSTYGDHRIAMMIFIASLIAKHSVIIDEIDSITISYPHFLHDFKKITQS